MKIILLIPTLRGGGAERVASMLCSYWADELGTDIKPHLLTFDDPKNDFYKLSDKVVRHSVGWFNQENSNILKRIFSNLIRLLRIRKIFISLKPDIVVAFMPEMSVLSILASLWTKIPVVISERSYPSYHNDGNLFDIIRKICYKLSSAFVSQTNCTALWAKNFLKTTKIEIIPNPVKDRVPLKLRKLPTKRQKIILAVGRLHTHKGFDMLIDAYANIYKAYPEWKLVIVGEGEEREQLTTQIKKAKLEQYVILAGQVMDPEYYYELSEIFVLSSRVEGFPNVLLEAIWHGLSVISFDCKAGPSDLIKDGKNGLLVPVGDVRSLSEAMVRLIRNKALREKLSNEALKMLGQYALPIVSKKWISLFSELINNKR